MKLILALFLLVPSVSYAETYKLLEDWTVELAEPERATDYPFQFFVGGLNRNEDAVYVASANGIVAKRSLLSGEPIWRTKLEGDSQSKWSFHEGRIYGGDSEGFLYAIDADSGEIVWKVANKGVYFSAPLVREGRLWVINSFGDLESYSIEDGKWLWQQKDPESVKLGLWGEQGPQMFGNQIVVGFPSGVLQAFDSQSGSRTWTSSFRSVVNDTMGLNDMRSFSVEGEYLVASSFNGNTRAWQLVGGSKKQIWEKRLSVPEAVTFVNGGSQFLASDREGRLSLFESSSGFAQWQTPLPGGLGSQPAVSDRWIWVGTSDGRVLVFDREGNEVQRSRDLQTSFYNQPLVIDDNTALVLSSRGILRRFQMMKVSSGEKPDLRKITSLF